MTFNKLKSLSWKYLYKSHYYNANNISLLCFWVKCMMMRACVCVCTCISNPNFWQWWDSYCKQIECNNFRGWSHPLYSELAYNHLRTDILIWRYEINYPAPERLAMTALLSFTCSNYTGQPMVLPSLSCCPKLNPRSPTNQIPPSSPLCFYCKRTAEWQEEIWAIWGSEGVCLACSEMGAWCFQ